jgi:hypothetical protein
MAITNSQVTRFYDRVFGRDGPVSGAIQLIHVPVIFAASAGTQTYRVNFPAGMGFEITDAEFTGGTVTAVIGITIGDTAAGTQVVASVTATTNLGALTIKDGTIDAGGFCEIVVAATASGAVNGAVDLVGYVTSPPTSIAPRPAV